MNQKNSGDKRKMNHKRLAMLLSLILVITCTVGGTLAYLFTRTESITDTFVPAQVSCTISDDQTTVTNGSETSVWLRVTITAVYRSTSDPTAIHWENPPISITASGDWFYNENGDGFYYYNLPVDSNGVVTLPKIEINQSDPAGFQLEKQILAEVIQSAPLIAVQEAWGMTRVDDQWQVYTSTPIE